MIAQKRKGVPELSAAAGVPDVAMAAASAAAGFAAFVASPQIVTTAGCQPPAVCSTSERMAKEWLITHCTDCRTEIPYLLEWSRVPDLCKPCRERRAAQWYDRTCEDCRTTIRCHRDWSNPPSLCPSCKQRRRDQWYERRCEDCGATMRLHRQWTNPPGICKPCRERRAAAWTEKRCGNCASTMRVHRDWTHPPVWCKSCTDSYPPRSASCEHCGSSFEIPTGTRINCKIKGWDEPKRCAACRELFKWKPFTTRREHTVLGTVVVRTYNSRGQLIRESIEEYGILDGKRTRHRDKHGRTHAYSYEREGPLGPYTETTDQRGRTIDRKPRS